MAKSEQQKLKEKLDKVFSLWVRQSNADDNEYCKCVTCGKIAHWKEMDAGHYIPRNILATRWDERNVQPQCRGCNRFGGGKPDEYAIWLRQKYGETVLEELHAQKHTITKLYIGDYEAKIADYESRLGEGSKNASERKNGPNNGI